MRRSIQLVVPAVVALVVAACDKAFGPDIEAPANLVYRLEPSGDPALPAGLVLEWDAVSNPDLEVYNVYSRPSQDADYALRGSTTSTTFHDGGFRTSSTTSPRCTSTATKAIPARRC